MQLRKLADTLELALFEQRGRRLVLTAAGLELQAACAELLELFGRAEARLERLRRPPAESLRLAAEPEAREVAARLLAAYSSRHPGVQVTLHVAERAQLLARFSAGEDDVYLFGLEVEGLPSEQRWSLVHETGRALVPCAMQFLREALVLDALAGPANNSAPTEENEWSSRASTTRRST
jgi:DNA-binding transcriptional LysR family regulator